jgi:hypothetical protein
MQEAATLQSENSTTSDKPMPTKAEQGVIQSKIKFIDSLCRIGEEPYEIQFLVSEAGSLIGKAFADHISEYTIEELIGISGETSMRTSQPPAEQSKQFYSMYVESLFNYVYLCSSSTRRSILRCSEPTLKDFFIQFTDELGCPYLRSEPFFYVTWVRLFWFMERCGIAVNARLREQLIHKIANNFARVGGERSKL